MANLVLSPVIEVFRWSLQPIAPFTWFGLPITSLDVFAILRTCIALRQIRELLHSAHVSKKLPGEVEEDSYVKRVLTTLLVVYGGEALTCALFGLDQAVPGANLLIS